jgi:hypothetical protein
LHHPKIDRYLPLAILNILLVSCVPGTTEHQRDVANLPKVFSVLRSLKVKHYRNLDWCKNISYQRGDYSTNLNSTTCNLFDGNLVVMDDRAKQDFQTIANALASTGVGISGFSAYYDPADSSEERLRQRLVKADFDLSVCRCTYVYQPRYDRLPDDGLKGKLEFTKINADWYFIWKD